MVGVPGRSKSCSTCRKRKKRCDRTIPTCNQCVKAGLPCEGYARDVIFVHATTTACPVSSRDGPQQRPWFTQYSKQARTVALPDPLVRSAREQLYLGHFWSAMLPGGRMFSPEAATMSSVGWTRLVGEFYDSEPSLRYVSLASAMAALAAQNQDHSMRLRALQTYNASVCELGRRLAQRRPDRQESLIVTARLMASFDLVFVMDRDPRVIAWRGHSEGQQAMFLGRGPDAFTSGAAHQLFVDARINLAMLAIGRRETSPFSSHAWKTIPWSLQPKSIMDKLQDIMQDIPGLLELINPLEPGLQEARGVVISRCRDMEQALEIWACEARPDLFRFDYTCVNLPIPIPKTDTEFALLHLSIIYWFIQSMMYSIWAFASASNEAREMLTSSVSKGAHAIPLLFEPGGGIAENISGLLALSISLRYFITMERPGRRSEELQSLCNILDREILGTPVRALIRRMYGGRDPLEFQVQREAEPADVVGWF
ncbi:hypothetical protein ACJZ2D_005453 [Fusarium nematophilum]